MHFILIIFIFLFVGFPVFSQDGAAAAQDLPAQSQASESNADEETEPAAEIDIEELRARILNESPNEILSLSIRDTNVSFFISGSWKGDLQFHPGYSISPLTRGFTPLNTPIFMQEADITLALWINNRWFVEANFLDDYSMTTYRAGYKRDDGYFLKYFGIGNTGLDFPSFSYLDLGGDSPSSFGLYSNFGNDKLDFHALFRYDTSSREERVFSGGRERTYSYVKPENILRGVSFVLPDTDIDSQITIYIEDEKGDIRDLSENRRWRRALSSEYAFSRSSGLLEFSIRSKGMIAVSYTKNGSRPWNVSMGSYDGADSFLKSIQNWFDPGRQTIKLEDYPQAGNRVAANGRPGEIRFNEGEALVIYEPGAFSPFERQNRYDAPSSSSENASFVRVSDETKINGYELIQFDSFSILEDFLIFFSETTQRGVYELLKTVSKEKRAPESMFPLADEYAQIYLPGSGVFSGDAVLRFTNFLNTNGYFIGTDVVPGSVQVWRSGIQDTNFSYNPSSGEVLIRGSVGQNELIRVTYLKRSEETRFGSIAAGVGFIYNNNKHFSFHTALGLRFNLSDEEYTQEDSSSMGNVGLSVKAAWDYPNIKAHIAGGFFFDRIDTTDLYRAIGMEGNEFITSLPPDTSFISNPPSSIILQNIDMSILNRADLIYRDYNNDNLLGHKLMPIDWGADVVSGISKPYAASDPQLGNARVITAEFNLENGNWTGFQASVINYTDVLSAAGEIEIPFRFYDFTEFPASGFKLIIQIGSLSGKDFSFAENTFLIWEKILYTDNLISMPDDYYTSVEFNQDARIARFKLNEEDRRKLGNANFIRLIAVNENTNVNTISGRVLLAPPIVRGASFKAVSYDGNETYSSDNVRAIETIDTGQSLKSTYPNTEKFHITGNDQRVLRIDWDNLETGIAAGVEGMTSLIPLSDYRELSFFVKIREDKIKNNNEFIRFVISQASGAFDNSILDAYIPMNMLETEKWTKVTIRYQGEEKGISVDGRVSPNASFTYTPVRRTFDTIEKKAVYFAFLVNPTDFSQKLEDGTIFLDEIILEDSIMVYRMNAGAGFEYTKKGDFVSTKNKNIPVFSDFLFNTALESEAHTSAEKTADDLFGSVVSRSGIGISFFGVKLSGNFSFTAAQDTFLWSADHEISRSIKNFSFKESYYASPDENKARHNFNLGYQSNFHTRFEMDALYDLSKLRQNWKFDIGYRSKNEYIPAVSFNTNALWTSNSTVDNNDNYGSLWIRSWDDMIPDLGESVESRRTSAQFTINQRTKPVGAVITLDGNAFSSSMNNITRFENSAFLDIPVAVKKAAMNFRMGRGFKQHINYFGIDVIDDTNNFFKSVHDTLTYWKSIPFYSLFDLKLNDLMDEGLQSSPFSSITQYTSFNEHFSARLNLTSIYNLLSFFIPVKYTLRVDRIIEQKMDTRADNLNIGAGVGFSSVNMFGAMGYKPIFKFYQSDEFSHGFDAVFTIPRDEEMQWRLQSVLNAKFAGQKGGIVNFLNTLTFRSDDSWLESFTAIWEAPTKKNLMSMLYNLILKGVSKQESWLHLSAFINPDYEQLRRESLELTFDKSSDYLRWSVSAGHEEIVRILGRLNLNMFMKLKIGKDLFTETLLMDLLIGIGLRVSF